MGIVSGQIARIPGLMRLVLSLMCIVPGLLALFLT
jgi:hypothetical protein